VKNTTLRYKPLKNRYRNRIFDMKIIEIEFTFLYRNITTNNATVQKKSHQQTHILYTQYIQNHNIPINTSYSVEICLNCHHLLGQMNRVLPLQCCVGKQWETGKHFEMSVEKLRLQVAYQIIFSPFARFV
jgi:hypothetical protein